MRTRTRWATGTAGVAMATATALGVSGCGAVAAIEPKVAFAKAYAGTTSQQDMTSTMSLSMSEADVTKLADALAPKPGTGTSSGMEAMGREALVKILPKLKITTRAHSNGKPLNEETDPKKIDQAASITVGGKGMDIVQAAQGVYLKVDVDGLGQETGLFTDAQARGMVGSLPPQLSWVGDLVKGSWIGLPPSVVQQYLASSGTGSLQDPGTQKKMRESMEKSMERNASFEKTGSSDAGDQITVKVKLKPFAEDMVKAQQEAMPSAMPSGATGPKVTDSGAIKDDAVLEMRTVVKNDRVVHAETPLAQVLGWLDESTMKASDKATFDRVKAAGVNGSFVIDTTTDGGAVSVPSGARMLTQQEIDQMTSMSKATASR